MVATGLKNHFEKLVDPRVQGRCAHRFLDILCIGLCAVLCGAEGFKEIEEFGKSKKDWLSSWLTLASGIPSHDTFRRVFAALDPVEFGKCFMGWTLEARKLLGGELINVDGKLARGSRSEKKKQSALGLVGAWSSENRMILGQIATDEDSNEIPAVPRLLRALELSGCIVTLDAMGCQREIAEVIVERGADYVLALKGNQPALFESTQKVLAKALGNELDEGQVDCFVSSEKAHGREEKRIYVTTNLLDEVEEKEKWKNLTTLGVVESHRTIDGVTTLSHRYYISSLELTAEQFSQCVRGHWGIENSLHWVLDVAFGEDACRIQDRNAAENFATLRRFALNMLRQDKSVKVGVKAKRLKAGWDNAYLEKLLTS